MFDAIVRQGTLQAVVVLIFCVLAVAAALRMPVQMIPTSRCARSRSRRPGRAPRRRISRRRSCSSRNGSCARAQPRAHGVVCGNGARVDPPRIPVRRRRVDALIRVNNALSQVPAYPENVDEPRLSTNSFSENAFMYYRLIARDGNPLGLDLNLMQDFAEDHIRPRMERVAGVSRVDVSGGAARQVRIEVDAARLAERGLSLVDLRDAVRLRNRDASAGDIDSGKRATWCAPSAASRRSTTSRT
jgi:hypothetical protein